MWTQPVVACSVQTVNSLLFSDVIIWHQRNWINIGLGDGLFPDILWHSNFTLGQFHRKCSTCSRYWSMIWFWKLLIWDYSHISQGPMSFKSYDVVPGYQILPSAVREHLKRLGAGHVQHSRDCHRSHCVRPLWCTASRGVPGLWGLHGPHWHGRHAEHPAGVCHHVPQGLCHHGRGGRRARSIGCSSSSAYWVPGMLLYLVGTLFLPISESVINIYQFDP